MTKYREILRLLSNKLKTDEIVQACSVSKKTVIKVKKRAAELGICWPLGDDMTNEKLEAIMFPKATEPVSTKRTPDFEYIRKELLLTGLTKSFCGLSIWSNVVEKVPRLSCILNSVITSNRTNRSDTLQCTFPGNPASRQKSTGLGIQLISLIEIPVRRSRLTSLSVDAVIEKLNKEYYDKNGYPHLARTYRPGKGSSVEF